MSLQISKCLLTAFGCLAGATLLADDPTPGKQVEQKQVIKIGAGETAQEVTVHYWLFLPQGYGEKANGDHAKKWPLVLFLHGAGERGTDMNLVKVHGPPKLVDADAGFPFIVVSPQCPSGELWNSDLMAKIVDQLANSLAVDPARLYVTGLSMGGYGTWDLLAKYPGKFAAAMPICGGGDPLTVEKYKATPIWVFHGAKDSAVSLTKSDEMVAALKKAGGDPKYTVYPEAHHDSWTETYKNPDVWKWLAEQKLAEKKQ